MLVEQYSGSPISSTLVVITLQLERKTMADYREALMATLQIIQVSALVLFECYYNLYFLGALEGIRG